LTSRLIIFGHSRYQLIGIFMPYFVYVFYFLFKDRTFLIGSGFPICTSTRMFLLFGVFGFWFLSLPSAYYAETLHGLLLAILSYCCQDGRCSTTTEWRNIKTPLVLSRGWGETWKTPRCPCVSVAFVRLYLIYATLLLTCLCSYVLLSLTDFWFFYCWRVTCSYALLWQYTVHICVLIVNSLFASVQYVEELYIPVIRPKVEYSLCTKP
jgi:hypothetical protein